MIKLATILTILGIVFDLCGALMMYQKIDVTTYVYNEDETAGINRKKNRRLRIGFSLLLIGIIFQLIALAA